MSPSWAERLRVGDVTRTLPDRVIVPVPVADSAVAVVAAMLSVITISVLVPVVPASVMVVATIGVETVIVSSAVTEKSPPRLLVVMLTRPTLLRKALPAVLADTLPACIWIGRL